ncbi:hypothetical protein [Phenylobacterium sp.]
MSEPLDPKTEERDPVQEAGEESFPASDPPAFVAPRRDEPRSIDGYRER